jgi:hypothetical protein
LIFVARGAETQPFGETKASPLLYIYMGVCRWLTILGASLLKGKIRGREKAEEDFWVVDGKG